jgi:glycosyltransferase involved in cell wall biosynthesis
MTAPAKKHAFIVSDVLGQKAGAYRLTALLAQELARLGMRVTCFAQAEDWAANCRPDSFAVVRPWLRRGSRWSWQEQCLAWQARRSIQTEQPDFVFVVGVTALARRLLQTEVAPHLVILELTNATPANKFVDAEASRLLGRARAVLSPSEAIDRAIRDTYGYRGLLMRLPFWVEDLRQPYLPPPPAFLADFIFLGRLDEEKGLNELLHATALVAKQFPGLRVLIAGQGSQEPFAALARSLGVSPNVDFQFFDYRHQTDKMKALGSSRCLVLPSYHEGYPLVLLEAVQMSVPFIATQVGSIPDAFGRSDAALLIPPRNADALATAMLTIMTEPSDRYAARRQAAWSAFSNLSSAAKVDDSLRELLEKLEAEDRGQRSEIRSQRAED